MFEFCLYYYSCYFENNIIYFMYLKLRILFYGKKVILILVGIDLWFFFMYYLIISM